MAPIARRLGAAQVDPVFIGGEASFRIPLIDSVSRPASPPEPDAPSPATPSSSPPAPLDPTTAARRPPSPPSLGVSFLPCNGSFRAQTLATKTTRTSRDASIGGERCTAPKAAPVTPS